MPSHNSKYYTKSLKTNTVKSHSIATLFRRKISESPDREPSSSFSKNIDQNQDSAESISDDNSGSIHVSTSEVTDAEISDDDSISQVSTLEVLNAKVKGDAVTPTIELLDNQGSSSTSETVDNSKSKTKTSDLRKMGHKSYEKQFPHFYYKTTEDGWYCKICSSFADIRITDQAFVNKVSTFDDHPTRRSSIYHPLSTRKASKINKLVMNFRKKYQCVETFTRS